MPPSEPLCVTILAGGRGSRLGGVDKAALDLCGKPLLEHVLAAVGPLAAEILIVANDDRLGGDARFTIIRDPEPHAGVLPALLAALGTTTSPLMLLVACDMPFLNPSLIEHLAERAAEYDVVMPKVDEHDQPMHAIYRVEPCRAAVRAALDRGDRRMISFLDDVLTLSVDEPEITEIDRLHSSFFNINTPYDLEIARKWAASGGW